MAGMIDIKEKFLSHASATIRSILMHSLTRATSCLGLAVALGAPLLLTACTTPRVKVPGVPAFSSSPSPSTRYITALQGGIVGRAGVEISASDRSRALEAEYRALEAAPGGQPVAWSGRGVSGEVVAAAPYQVGSQNCRQYTHTLSTGEKQAKARGAACRNPDGSWSPLN